MLEAELASILARCEDLQIKLAMPHQLGGPENNFERRRMSSEIPNLLI